MDATFEEECLNFDLLDSVQHLAGSSKHFEHCLILHSATTVIAFKLCHLKFFS